MVVAAQYAGRASDGSGGRGLVRKSAPLADTGIGCIHRIRHHDAARSRLAVRHLRGAVRNRVDDLFRLVRRARIVADVDGRSTAGTAHRIGVGARSGMGHLDSHSQRGRVPADVRRRRVARRLSGRRL